MSKKLSVHQARVYFSFSRKNKDTDIEEIYAKVYGISELNRKGTTIRIMQQKLAPTFAAINKKIAPHSIVPGLLKRTYRLNTRG